ncbi:tail completion protein gp17 [Pantoea endophytica]
MTEAGIFSLIGHLAGGQVYPYVAPLNAAGDPAVKAPWVIFSISESYGDTLCGPAEENGMLQVDVYALSTDEARSIRELAVAALMPLEFTQMQKGNGYETDTGLYRATLEIQSQQ